MIPGHLDLPTIWRGCDWPAVTLKWKDQNGNPLNLTGYTPIATANNSYSLNPVVTDAANGVTQVSMNKTQSALVKLGDMAWDWVWLSPSGYRWPPMLSGKIPVKEPNTNNGANGQ